jgi:rubredoxin
MATVWKCQKCGYRLEADSPPEKCPGCMEKCEFVDVTCYTPECAGPGVDERISSDTHHVDPVTLKGSKS